MSTLDSMDGYGGRSAARGAPATAVLAASGLLVVSLLYVSIPLAPLVADDLAVSARAASWLGAAFGLPYGLGFLVWGAFSDRYGRKAVIAVGLAALSAVTLAVGASPSFGALLALRVAQGFVAATFAPAALAYLAEALPPASRPRAISFLTLGFLLAGLAGQVYASAIAGAAGASGWRWAFWALSPAYLTLAGLVALVLPPGHEQRDAPSLPAAYAGMLALLGNRALLATFVGALAVLLPFVAVYSGLGSYGLGAFGLRASDLLPIRAAGVAGMLLAPLAGLVLIPRCGARAVAVGGLLTAAAGLLGFAVASSAGSVPALVAASVVFVAGVSASVPSLIAVVGSLAPGASGAAVALYSFVMFVGAGLGPLAAGQFAGAGFGAACASLAAFVLACAVVVRLGVPTRARKGATGGGPGVSGS